MKVIFKEAGLPVAPGLLATTAEEAVQYAKTVGYPFILKPDIGVGAFGARRISSEEELKRHWEPNYFLEQFVKGDIETFDGLTDVNGDIMFNSTLGYSSGVMEILQGETDTVFFYVKKEVPEDLRVVGTKVVKAFDIKSRFFHVEFFRLPDGGLLPLEVNLRPPGGVTVDMWNYAHQADLYNEYANVIANQPANPFIKALYYCVYSGRRYNIRYKYKHEEIVQKLGKKLQMHYVMPHVFSGAMGDETYIYLCDSMQELKEITSYIDEREKITAL